MKIEQVDTIPFSLPLQTPWRSARGSMQQRPGWVIQVRTDAGLLGFGECSPLPEAGSETHQQAQLKLSAAAHTLVGKGISVGLELLQGWKDSPAAHCGMETALLDLLAREQQLPLHCLLNPSSSDRVAVNGFLGSLNGVDSQQLATMAQAGYRVAKLKVGLGSIEDELNTLERISREIPSGMELRLDANGAWHADQAARFIEGLCDLPVESLEEPLRQFDPNLWDHLQKQCPFPLALDESIGSLDENKILECGVKRLVLKPMVLGGIRACQALAQKAAENDIQTLVTSTVDGAIGVHAAAHLAAAIDISGEPMAHGLDTSRWLQRNIAPPPCIESAQIRLSAIHGLGVTLNITAS